ncbi:MAG: MBL fold metallo-hydrolase [Methanoregula sp.]|nr:MBL fold metallo-hydrolase [Methanoregula sp.]
MPVGKELLTPLVWQPVPGARGAECYPIIRKIDTVSSNSYLLRTPDALLLIDPGGLAEQADHLVSVIEECRKDRYLPLVIFLTHAHVDHFLSLCQSSALTDPTKSTIAIHEIGAIALEEGDRNVTQAAILGAEIGDIGIGLRLLSREGAATPGIPVTLTFPNGASITTIRDMISTASGAPTQRERITFGTGEGFEIYHTPGHSPDSICLRFGRMLFIGDMLFAANPGVAGLCGWSQESLVDSIDTLTPLITGNEIDLVCPGHGRVIPVETARTMINAIRRDAVALHGIEELNPERSQTTAVFAEECLSHVSELFTIMAGRLYYVSYVIEELGEADMAEQLGTLIKSDTVDAMLDEFTAFSEEFRSGKQQPIHLALKAAQVIAKIERSFDGAALGRIIDPSLISRASRLIADYTTTLRGFSPPTEYSEQNISSILESLVISHTVPACSDDDFLSSADDNDAFVQILLSRIGTPPLLKDVEVTFECPDPTLVAPIDHDRFCDLVTEMLEDLVGTGAGNIRITAQRSGSAVVVTLSGTGCIKSLDSHYSGFLRRACHAAGGSFTYDYAGTTSRFVITLDPV